MFEYAHVVEHGEIDQLGHANNVSFLSWTQAAALAHSAARGWPTQRYIDLGAGWVVRSHRIDYLQPAFAGDEIVVRTWVAGMRKATSLRRYEIIGRCGDTLLARAETDWAFIDYASGKPRRIPHDVASAFEIIADERP